MASRLREQFNTSALILSVIALVFALMGGAYAASSARPRSPRSSRAPLARAVSKASLVPPSAAGPIGSDRPRRREGRAAGRT